MKHRILPVILIFLASVILCVESGCSRTDKGNCSVQTLTFWHSFTSSTMPVLEQMIVDFEAIHPGIQIRAQYVPTGDALVQKLITAIQSGTEPDIAWIHADFLDRLVESKSIYSLNELASGDSAFLINILPDIFPQLLKSVTIRDTVYALPMEATTLGLLYNKDMFREAGLDPGHPPATHAELDSFAGCLSRDINNDGLYDKFGFYVPVFPASGQLNIWMIMQWTPFVWQCGGSIFHENQPVFSQEAGIHALELWKKLYEQQQFERFSMAHDMGFMSQTVAMILDGPWNLPRYRDNIDFDWGVAPLPAGCAGNSTYLSGEYLAVFKKCRHVSSAWKFLQWFIEPDVQREFARRSGYLPVRRSLLQDSEYLSILDAYPQQKGFNELIDYARGRELPDRFRVEVNQHIAAAIENAVRGIEPAEMALKKADIKIQKLMCSE